MTKPLFVGREIEELRWKLLAEGKWKGLSSRQNSESKSRPLTVAWVWEQETGMAGQPRGTGSLLEIWKYLNLVF